MRRCPHVLAGTLSLLLASCACFAKADDRGKLLLEEVASVGQAVPGGTPGETFESFLQSSRVGDDGTVALVCRTRRAGEDKPRASLWSGTPGEMTRVATVGETAPALGDKPVLESFRLVGIDAGGRVLVDGKTVGRASRIESGVVWYGKGAFVGRLARSGESTVGGSERLNEVSAEALTAGGTIVLRSASRYFAGRADALTPVEFPPNEKPPRVVAAGDDGRVAWWAQGSPPKVGSIDSKSGKVKRIAAAEAMPAGESGETVDPKSASMVMADDGVVLIVCPIARASRRVATGCWLFDDSGKLTMVVRTDRPLAQVKEAPPGLTCQPQGEPQPASGRAGSVLQLVKVSDGGPGVARYTPRTGWSLIARDGGAGLGKIEWVSAANAAGQFLVAGEVKGHSGAGVYRVTVPK